MLWQYQYSISIFYKHSRRIENSSVWNNSFDNEIWQQMLTNTQSAFFSAAIWPGASGTGSPLLKSDWKVFNESSLGSASISAGGQAIWNDQMGSPSALLFPPPNYQIRQGLVGCEAALRATKLQLWTALRVRTRICNLNLKGNRLLHTVLR